VENSSAGCIPESKVIFPPKDKPLAGAIRSEVVERYPSGCDELYKAFAVAAHVALHFGQRGNSLPSVWLISNTYTARKPTSYGSGLRSSAALSVSISVATSFWRDLR
jgi:hypothetical protein